MNFKSAILIQARIGSSRLRSKVLHKINNLSIIELGFKRLKKSKKVNQIIHIIPNTSENEILRKEIESFGGSVFLGSENDLIERHLSCAELNEIDNIIRVTSDCPLVDPVEIDKFLGIYERINDDNLYLSNFTPPELSNYCNGSDIEIFSRKMLRKVNILFKSKKDREHVTFQFWDGRFKCNHYRVGWQGKFPINKVRLTIDYKEDLKVINFLSKEINLVEASLEEICVAYDKHNLFELNGNFDSKAGWK